MILLLPVNPLLRSSSSQVLFCGFNPGTRSSQLGFHYAHPSNRFYRILHDSGLTPYRLKPEESPTMPERYRLGLTDLVARCTARADQVSSLEFQAGASGLLAKIVRYRPTMWVMNISRAADGVHQHRSVPSSCVFGRFQVAFASGS